jgi:hypothetical protein
MRSVLIGIKRIFIVLCSLYLVLLIPDCNEKKPLVVPNAAAFSWNKDSLWNQLEQNFAYALSLSKDSLQKLVVLKSQIAENRLNSISDSALPFDAPVFDSLLNDFLAISPLVAASSDSNNWYFAHYNQLRRLIKLQSRNWAVKEPVVRNRLYSILYGTRAAVEEVLLQKKETSVPDLMMVDTIPSFTPSARILGVPVHSGDLLVSRGGAEVSAFISRGNNYPGNFSHVALLYVDGQTGKPWVVEAHIEKGVAVSDIDTYIRDKKLRFMVLRPYPALPLMQQDPLLPHKAAKAAYDATFSRHIPYDFSMNANDTAAMFCSEVAATAYRKYGIGFWSAPSTITQTGVVDWLNDFGVRYFETQIPSDLEYDPQLSLVAEWRDRETLQKDHQDNAMMDAMLEQANAGRKLKYNTWLLPVARVLKAYSYCRNLAGYEGIIPEGMTATQALKNEYFTNLHKSGIKHLQQKADAFRIQKGYAAPYWQLLAMSREILSTDIQ